MSFVSEGADDCGHGTHIAGIIAGNANLSTTQASGPKYTKTFSGIAPNANLVSVQVLDAQGQGNVSDVIAGISWITTNRPKYNIKVINISLGHTASESIQKRPALPGGRKGVEAGDCRRLRSR